MAHREYHRGRQGGFDAINGLSSSDRKCANSKCGARDSTTWLKGWVLHNGNLADLCHDCGTAYDEGEFCERHHRDDAGWRTCSECIKPIHCGCIASADLSRLLDGGGIECTACATKRERHEHFRQTHDVEQPPRHGEADERPPRAGFCGIPSIKGSRGERSGQKGGGNKEQMDKGGEEGQQQHGLLPILWKLEDGHEKISSHVPGSRQVKLRLCDDQVRNSVEIKSGGENPRDVGMLMLSLGKRSLPVVESGHDQKSPTVSSISDDKESSHSKHQPPHELEEGDKQPEENQRCSKRIKQRESIRWIPETDRCTALGEHQQPPYHYNPPLDKDQDHHPELTLTPSQTVRSAIFLQKDQNNLSLRHSQEQDQPCSEGVMHEAPSVPLQHYNQRSSSVPLRPSPPSTPERIARTFQSPAHTNVSTSSTQTSQQAGPLTSALQSLPSLHLSMPQQTRVMPKSNGHQQMAQTAVAPCASSVWTRTDRPSAYSQKATTPHQSSSTAQQQQRETSEPRTESRRDSSCPSFAIPTPQQIRPPSPTACEQAQPSFTASRGTAVHSQERHLDFPRGVGPSKMEEPHRRKQSQHNQSGEERNGCVGHERLQEQGQAVPDGLNGGKDRVNNERTVEPKASGDYDEYLPSTEGTPVATKPQRIVRLFEKMLSATDAGRIGRLVLPKAYAEAYFPPIPHPEGISLKLEDHTGREWTFQYRYWPNNNSRMYVLEGVMPCMNALQLHAGDTVTFSKIEPDGKLLMGYRRAPRLSSGVVVSGGGGGAKNVSKPPPSPATTWSKSSTGLAKTVYGNGGAVLDGHVSGQGQQQVSPSTQSGCLGLDDGHAGSGKRKGPGRPPGSRNKKLRTAIESRHAMLGAPDESSEGAGSDDSQDWMRMGAVSQAATARTPEGNAVDKCEGNYVTARQKPGPTTLIAKGGINRGVLTACANGNIREGVKLTGGA